MKIGKISILVLLLVVSHMSLFAQKEPMREEIARTSDAKLLDKQDARTLNHKNSDVIFKMKSEFFKKNLQLTEKNADKFWEKFDDFLVKEKSIHKQHKELLEENGIRREKGKVNFEKLNDEQIFFYYESKWKMKQEMLKLEEAFYNDMKKLINPQSVVKFYQLERAFKNEISSGVKKTREHGAEGERKHVQPEKTNN